MFLIIKSSAPASTLIPQIRKTINQTSPDTAVGLLKEYDVIAKESVWQRRLWSFVLTVFALLALLLTAIGLYDVLSDMVAQRTRDLGIRLAIGAQRSDIFRLVMGGGMRLVGIGGVVGLIAAYLAARALQNILFDVSGADVLTDLAIVMLMSIVCVLACVMPAIRAMRTAPQVALKD